jgi:hypothetical protein
VQTISYSVLTVGWLDDFFDTHIVNSVFDEGCQNVSRGGQRLALLQSGQIQTYLRIIGCALIALALYLLWGAKA